MKRKSIILALTVVLVIIGATNCGVNSKDPRSVIEHFSKAALKEDWKTCYKLSVASDTMHHLD